MKSLHASRLLFSIATLIAVITLDLGAARAQLPPEIADRMPAQFASDAFATNYGRLLVAEFGKVLRAGADRDCLRAKNIDPQSLEERGRTLLVRNGTRMLEIASELIDTTKFETALAGRAGRSAKAEYLRLRSDPEVKRYIELEERGRFAMFVNTVIETIGRHALLSRIKPLGDVSMLRFEEAVEAANPENDSFEASDRLVRTSKSSRLQRWLKLSRAIGEASRDATNREMMSQLGPIQQTPELKSHLTELCIPVPP